MRGPCASPRSVCSARVTPSTTGSTTSRWLGFEASVTLDLAASASSASRRRRGGTSRRRCRPRDRTTTASIVRSPSNSTRIVLVRAAEHVREHVEPAAVRHAEHDLVRAALGGELDRLVEHRHERRRGPRSRTASGRGTRAGGSARSTSTSVRRSSSARFSSARERLAVAARLDRLAQPDALLVVGDVLDLVGDRPAVGLAAAPAAPRRASRPRT